MAEADRQPFGGDDLRRRQWGVVERVIGVLGDAGPGFLALLYPPRCAVCDSLDASYLCLDCRTQIEIIAAPVCARCGAPAGEPGVCGHCSEQPRAFRAARSAGRFDGVLRDLILRFKYSPAKPLAQPLSELLLECMQRWRTIGPEKCDLIVPVPIHLLRLRTRDYNQSAELARELGRRIGMPVDCGVLRKVRETRPQTMLSARDRKTNLREAFAVRGVERVAGRRVLLIDDVMTTGATADECARVLCAAGAKEVRVLTLARESSRM